jgi:hypothetical protein
MSEIWFSIESRMIPRVERDEGDKSVMSCGDELKRGDDDVTAKTTSEKIIQFLETRERS